MPTSYNHIFTKLVRDDPDFVGMVAYTLYKKQKIEWIKQFASNNDGREPDEHELEPFHAMSNMESMIDSYRNQAVDLLDGFLDFALADKVEQIRQELVREESLLQQGVHHNAVKQICQSLSDDLQKANGELRSDVVRKVDKPFLQSVAENVLAGIATSLITLATAGLVWVALQGPERLLKEALQKGMQTGLQSMPPAEASSGK